MTRSLDDIPSHLRLSIVFAGLQMLFLALMEILDFVWDFSPHCPSVRYNRSLLVALPIKNS